MKTAAADDDGLESAGRHFDAPVLGLAARSTTTTHHRRAVRLGGPPGQKMRQTSQGASARLGSWNRSDPPHPRQVLLH